MWFLEIFGAWRGNPGREARAQTVRTGVIPEKPAQLRPAGGVILLSVGRYGARSTRPLAGMPYSRNLRGQGIRECRQTFRSGIRKSVKVLVRSPASCGARKYGPLVGESIRYLCDETQEWRGTRVTSLDPQQDPFYRWSESNALCEYGIDDHALFGRANARGLPG